MIENIEPREQNGRDSFGRYRAQVRSVAIAALSLLDGNSVDRVYCDLHDDFVVRVNSCGQYFYIFYQVKTKGQKNYNWTINDVFGLNTKIKNQKKQSDDKIKNSFAGKLLMHTINFGDQCNAVIFQTNVHTDDNIDALIKDIKGGNFANKYSKVLVDRFNCCFAIDAEEKLTEDCVKTNLAKLKFETDIQYLKDGVSDFEPIAREQIYKYSEIDLQHDEVQEILLKLVELVSQKSSGIIAEYNRESIEEAAGISIEDLLQILSISKDAYKHLVEGGDCKAIKNASIIQRSLSASGASIDQINYCSKCKTAWDTWVRKNRHILPELDLYTISSKARKIIDRKTNYISIEFGSLRQSIETLMEELKNEDINYDLTNDLLLGAIFSELVRGN